jgi:hypothetical protein
MGINGGSGLGRDDSTAGDQPRLACAEGSLNHQQEAVPGFPDGGPSLYLLSTGDAGQGARVDGAARGTPWGRT